MRPLMPPHFSGPSTFIGGANSANSGFRSGPTSPSAYLENSFDILESDVSETQPESLGEIIHRRQNRLDAEYTTGPPENSWNSRPTSAVWDSVLPPQQSCTEVDIPLASTPQSSAFMTPSSLSDTRLLKIPSSILPPAGVLGPRSRWPHRQSWSVPNAATLPPFHHSRSNSLPQLQQQNYLAYNRALNPRLHSTYHPNPVYPVHNGFFMPQQHWQPPNFSSATGLRSRHFCSLNQSSSGVMPIPGSVTHTLGTSLDIRSLLRSILTRPNPKYDVGAVDINCALTICDGSAYDHPIVFASDALYHMTGYGESDLLGKNCRLFQDPAGGVQASRCSESRSHEYRNKESDTKSAVPLDIKISDIKGQLVDTRTIASIRHALERGEETRHVLINYRKGGVPFLNALTIIPLEYKDKKYFVGFMLDLVESPDSVTVSTHSSHAGDILVDYKHASQNMDGRSWSGKPNENLSLIFDNIKMPTEDQTRKQEFYPGTIHPLPHPDSLMHPAPSEIRSNSRKEPKTEIPNDRPATGAGQRQMNDSSSSKAALESYLEMNCKSYSGPPQSNVSSGPASIPNIKLHSAYRPPDSSTVPSIPENESTSTVLYNQHFRHRPPVGSDRMISFLDSLTDIVLILNPRGVLQYASPASCKRSLEYHHSDIVGNHISTICHPSDIVYVTRSLLALDSRVKARNGIGVQSVSSGAQGDLQSALVLDDPRSGPTENNATFGPCDNSIFSSARNHQGSKALRPEQRATDETSMVFRTRKKHGGWVWIECRCTMFSYSGLQACWVLLVGRERRPPPWISRFFPKHSQFVKEHSQSPGIDHSNKASPYKPLPVSKSGKQWRRSSLMGSCHSTRKTLTRNEGVHSINMGVGQGSEVANWNPTDDTGSPYSQHFSPGDGVWMKVSISGILLYVSSNSTSVLGKSPATLVGQGIQVLRPNGDGGEMGHEHNGASSTSCYDSYDASTGDSLELCLKKVAASGKSARCLHVLSCAIDNTRNSGTAGRDELPRICFETLAFPGNDRKDRPSSYLITYSRAHDCRGDDMCGTPTSTPPQVGVPRLCCTDNVTEWTGDIKGGGSDEDVLQCQLNIVKREHDERSPLIDIYDFQDTVGAQHVQCASRKSMQDNSSLKRKFQDTDGRQSSKRARVTEDCRHGQGDYPSESGKPRTIGYPDSFATADNDSPMFDVSASQTCDRLVTSNNVVDDQSTSPIEDSMVVDQCMPDLEPSAAFHWKSKLEMLVKENARLRAQANQLWGSAFFHGDVKDKRRASLSASTFLDTNGSSLQPTSELPEGTPSLMQTAMTQTWAGSDDISGLNPATTMMTCIPSLLSHSSAIQQVPGPHSHISSVPPGGLTNPSIELTRPPVPSFVRTTDSNVSSVGGLMALSKSESSLGQACQGNKGVIHDNSRYGIDMESPFSGHGEDFGNQDSRLVHTTNGPHDGTFEHAGRSSGFANLKTEDQDSQQCSVLAAVLQSHSQQPGFGANVPVDNIFDARVTHVQDDFGGPRRVSMIAPAFQMPPPMSPIAMQSSRGPDMVGSGFNTLSNAVSPARGMVISNDNDNIGPDAEIRELGLPEQHYQANQYQAHAVYQGVRAHKDGQSISSGQQFPPQRTVNHTPLNGLYPSQSFFSDLASAQQQISQVPVAGAVADSSGGFPVSTYPFCSPSNAAAVDSVLGSTSPPQVVTTCSSIMCEDRMSVMVANSGLGDDGCFDGGLLDSISVPHGNSNTGEVIDCIPEVYGF